MYKNILRINPEFARNLWLEISIQRIIIAPVIIMLVCLLISINAGSDAYKIIHYSALAGFVFFGMIWGIKSASESVLDEYNERTWDWQRMSVIGPWKLAWGKLIGSTIYQWYISAICILIYFWSAIYYENPGREFKLGFLLILATITLHGMMILLSLLLMRKGDGRAKIKSTRIFILGLFLIMSVSRPFTMGVFTSRFTIQNDFSWYGIHGWLDIALISMIFYCGWMIAGLYRSMRTELQYWDTPKWWVTFLVTSVIFLFGYSADNSEISLVSGIALTLTGAFTQMVILTYFLALMEPKDVVNFRTLVDSFGKSQWYRFFTNIPLWLTTLPIAFLTGFFALIFAILAIRSGNNPAFIKFNELGTIKLVLFFISICGFILRDLAILLLLHFAPRARRADSAMMLYLVVLYLLLPILASNAGLGFLFYPDILKNPVLAALASPIEAAVAIYFLVARWKALNMKIETSSLEPSING